MRPCLQGKYIFRLIYKSFDARLWLENNIDELILCFRQQQYEVMG